MGEYIWLVKPFFNDENNDIIRENEYDAFNSEESAIKFARKLILFGVLNNVLYCIVEKWTSDCQTMIAQMTIE